MFQTKNIFNRLNKHPLSLILLAFIMLGSIAPITAIAGGPVAVDLFSADNFTILAETGITNTGSHTTDIKGNIGNSPGPAAQMDGVWCTEISGTIYGVDTAYTGNGIDTSCFAGGPSDKTLVDNAVNDMLTAYNNAAAVILPSPITELGGGSIGGMMLAPGVYKWSNNVNIATDITLTGGANDVWILQIAGNLNIASGGSVPTGIKVLLSGGAQAPNIFWQVGGVTGATLGTYSTFNGIILSAKQVILETGAVLNGKALAQTQVTLDGNMVLGCPMISLTPSALPLGTIMTPYSQMIVASGGTGPYTYSITSGTLPDGLSLNNATGLISGSPTTAGSSSFTVLATDTATNCTGLQDYTIVINPAVCPAISLDPMSLPAVTLSTPYSQMITASGGTGPYTYSISAGSLPAGLSLNTVTGLISGTPTTGTSSSFTVTATDTNTNCMGSQPYNITIVINPTIIPTLSLWGLISFILLMSLSSIYYMKRIRVK